MPKSGFLSPRRVSRDTVMNIIKTGCEPLQMKRKKPKRNCFALTPKKAVGHNVVA
jgi:hypothetical protein